MKQNHTPLPWTRDLDAICGPQRIHMAVAIGEDGDNYATQVANAALIVRAVNSHAALVDALESVIMHLEDNRGRIAYQRGSPIDSDIKSARAALAAAKAE